MTAIGASRRADDVGASRGRPGRSSMNGNAIAVIAKPIVVIATLASEKLRSSEQPERARSGSRLDAALPPDEGTEHEQPGGDQQRHAR